MWKNEERVNCQTTQLSGTVGGKVVFPRPLLRPELYPLEFSWDMNKTHFCGASGS
jgi:hypothetical protein